MSALFNLNGKTIKDSQIGNICLLIKLGKDFEDCEDNEEYVIDKLENKSNIFELDRFEIECPYKDLVYLSNESFTGEGEEGMYPSNEKELELLAESYKEALKVFDQSQLDIVVHSDYLWDNYNEGDFSLVEFKKYFKLI